VFLQIREAKELKMEAKFLYYQLIDKITTLYQFFPPSKVELSA